MSREETFQQLGARLTEMQSVMEPAGPHPMIMFLAGIAVGGLLATFVVYVQAKRS